MKAAIDKQQNKAEMALIALLVVGIDQLAANGQSYQPGNVAHAQLGHQPTAVGSDGLRG